MRRRGSPKEAPPMSINPGSEDPRRDDLLAMIKEGMKVVDADGDDVGTVSYVQMADLNDRDDVGAANRDEVGLFDLTPDNDPGDEGVLGGVFGIGDDVTERMERSGYVKIDASGIFTGDKYVEPYQIAAVDGDTVRLAVDKDDIEKPA
jgi:hypothetical protein